MPAKKTKGVTFRFTPDVKRMLDRAAQANQRSRTNLIEILLTEHCRVRGLLSPDSSGNKLAEH
jgi:hypothetical protein